MGSKLSISLTPDLSKQARRELGLSQNDVVKATGLQAYKLKQWEGRGLSIELADIRKLTEFYESQGVNLAELSEHINRNVDSGRDREPSNPGQSQPALQDGYTYAPRPGFFISPDLTAEMIDKLMMQMEANDDRVAELTSSAFKTGFLGGMTDETEASVRELFAALAENHLVFRFLQGRNIIAPTRDEPQTIGDYLAQWVTNESSAAPLLTQDSMGTSNGQGINSAKLGQKKLPQALQAATQE